MAHEIYRTVVQFEVISDEPLDDYVSLGEIEDACHKGSWSGRMLMVSRSESLPPREAAEALIKQGSDPEFMGLMMCDRCSGSGKVPSLGNMNSICEMCDGEGWYNEYDL